MRLRVLATLLAALISGDAAAYDVMRAPGYAAPDWDRPKADRIIPNGAGNTVCGEAVGCEAPSLRVLVADSPSGAGASPLPGGSPSARSFGIQCDGTADDTAALAKAAASGKRVLFPPGVCTSTAGIMLTSGTKFECFTPRACELRATGNIASQFIGGEGISDVEVTGFVLNTRKAVYPNNPVTVVSINRSTAGARVNLSGNYVAGATSAGLVVDNTATVTMNDNEVTDTYRDAIRSASSDGVSALRNNIHDLPNLANGFRAIIIGSSKNAIAKENRITHLRRSDGPEANFAFDFGGTVGFSITNNRIDGVQSFVDLEQGSARGEIADNIFKGSIVSAANVDTGSIGVYCINNGCSHIRIGGNDIAGVYTPIRIEGGFSYNIAGNDLHDFYGAGIVALPVSGSGVSANADSPSGAVGAIVARSNTITNGSLHVPRAQSGIDIQAKSGAVVGNRIQGDTFRSAIKDYGAGTDVEIADNLTGADRRPDTIRRPRQP